LIITDLNMPRMNGFEFLKAVKAHPSYKFTPVIMLTTEAGEDKKSQGRAAGAKAWITKPFQPQTLVDTVSKLVLA
jgi:two-component system chemotaxis response regulator CheY